MESRTKWKILVTTIVIGVLMTFSITASAAEIIAYGQPPGHFGGFLSDGQVMTVADEFQFEEAAAITSITWWGGYASEYLPITEVDNFTVQLFADDEGRPGATIQTFEVSNSAARTATGDYVNPPDPEAGFEGRLEYRYSFDLPVQIPVEANTRYWLSIVNVPSSDSWVWEVSDSLVNLGVQRSFEGGPWEPYYDNTAFQLKIEAAWAYEQPPGHFGGFLSDGQVMTVADEFQVEEAAAITSVTWWGGYASEYLPIPEADDFTVQLFADDEGKPGALIQTFEVSNSAMRTATGDYVNPPDPEAGFEGRPEYSYSFVLPVQILVEANTRYWLSIVNVPSSDSWVWEVSDSMVNLGVQRSFEGGPWEPYYDNTAFRLQTAGYEPPLSVEIDIRPFGPLNVIKLDSLWNVPVAILSQLHF